jgi:hypothetical protein
LEGKLFDAAGYPYAARLPLRKGSYRIQAELPGSSLRSHEVTIMVE